MFWTLYLTTNLNLTKIDKYNVVSDLIEMGEFHRSSILDWILTSAVMHFFFFDIASLIQSL
jgi:hypothetical protein